MSAGRWALSLFFVWHVTAIGLGSLASPGAVLPVDPPRYPQDNRLAATLTPALDIAAAKISTLPKALLRRTAPLQPFVNSYLRITGVSQSWKMFSNPPETHQYLRV